MVRLHGEIIDDIVEMVQGRDMFTMDDK